MVQFNLRISQEQADAVYAAVFVRDVKSPQALFEPVVERLVADLLRDEDVAAAVLLRQKRRREADGVVRALPRGASKKRGTSA